MTTLADVLLASPRREALTDDLVALVERHVERRAGLRGVALRAAMAAVHRKLPDAIPRAVMRLLPEFVNALEPSSVYSSWYIDISKSLLVMFSNNN